ncbi:MAG: hypothetical protein FH761_15985 [Firmicutes bacterium]|nr:hypothetical protein [Bacillota bacterium]
MSENKSITSLDDMRIKNGPKKLNTFFKELINTNLNEAIGYINDENLSYTTLYILKEEFEKEDMFTQLSIRNKIALDLTNEIINNENNNSINDYSSSKYVQMTNSTLKWILETGAENDGYNNEFDRILDISSILLTRVFKEKEILPLINTLIFDRYKRGALIHDLIWGYFESKDPHCLYFVGEKLKSENMKEVELACSLLKFIPELNLESNNSEHLYLTFIHWFEENIQFLKFTGESFQQTSNPEPFVIDMESKYLCKTATNICGDSKYHRLSTNESTQIASFNKLDSNSKSFLANFSYRMRKKNIYWWNSWMKNSIEDQLKIARTRRGLV